MEKLEENGLEARISALENGLGQLSSALSMFAHDLLRVKMVLQNDNMGLGAIIKCLVETKKLVTAEEFSAEVEKINEEMKAKKEEAEKMEAAKKSGIVLPGDPRFTTPPNIKGPNG